MIPPATELLLFQVGARLFASAVGDVVRIGSVRDVGPEELIEGTALGRTFSRERGLVVADQRDGGEVTLVVDQVLGLHRVAEGELHPIPPFAAALLPTEALAGIVLLDDAPTLLIDLPTLIRERRAAVPAQPT